MLRKDPEAVAAYRKALSNSTLYTPEHVAAMKDEEVIERTQQMLDQVLEFSRKMKPFVIQMSLAIGQMARLISDVTKLKQTFAELMDAEGKGTRPADALSTKQER